MGLHTKTLLFTFLNFSLIHGQNLCPLSSCGSSNMFTIKYPFKLQNQIPTNNCTYEFNLTCSKTDDAILTLPHAGGDFYIENIDYVQKHIQLYDPGSCLIRRLMNLSLKSSHLKAIYKEKYTLYVCPSDLQVGFRVYPIGCLSNNTNITIATRVISEHFFEGFGCRRFGSWKIPVSNPNEFEDAVFYGEFFLSLTWDADVCKDCEESDGGQDSGNSGRKPIARRVAIALISLPALTIIALICCSLFCWHLIRMISKKIEADPPTTATPPETTTLPPPSSGLDESKIVACTEIFVLSESDERIPSDNGNTCSICLEIFCKEEKLRIIRKCGHCFHASCIQPWLGKNSTCPVCRTSISDVDL